MLCDKRSRTRRTAHIAEQQGNAQQVVRRTRQQPEQHRMWIVAIGWIYVVTLMAATEPTVVGGIMTFFGYGVLPISLVFYLAGSGRRRKRTRQDALRAVDGTVSLPEAGLVPGAEGSAGGHAAAHGAAPGCDGGAGADGGCAGH
jgi:hypothetical protein